MNFRLLQTKGINQQNPHNSTQKWSLCKNFGRTSKNNFINIFQGMLTNDNMKMALHFVGRNKKIYILLL